MKWITREKVKLIGWLAPGLSLGSLIRVLNSCSCRLTRIGRLLLTVLFTMYPTANWGTMVKTFRFSPC